MQNFIIKPDISFYPGIKVDKNTELEYSNEFVKQELKKLTLHSLIKKETDDYTSTTELVLKLKKGDILILDADRGYILPGIPLATVDETIEELSCLKEV